MVKYVLIIMLLFNLAIAAELQGYIQYDENSARIEAFRDVARKIPKEMFKDFLKDKYQKENYENIKNKNYIIKSEIVRHVNPFYVLNTLALYSVEYEDDINKTYYYNVLGHLQKFEINDFDGSYPYRAISYDRKGNALNITFVVSENEAYVFDKDEKLLGHWTDSDFYNSKDKMIKKYKRILKNPD